MRAARRWKTGLAVAVVSFLVGTVRLLATGSTGWLTWVWFVLAAIYTFAGLVGRRLVFPERPQDWLGGHERKPRFVALLNPQHPSSIGETVGPSANSNVEQRIRYLQRRSDEAMTKNRIANALVTLAAIVGMVLVFTGAGQSGGGDDDDAPSTPSPPGQVAPAVPGPAQSGTQPGTQPGQVQPAPPAQSQAPAPGQTQAPAPAAPKKDNDGDDDDG